MSYVLCLSATPYPRRCVTFFSQDVSLASLYVSTKMHDTLKKPRELLAVSYAIRFPDLVAKSKHPGGEIDVDTMDQQVVERDRQRLLAIERLLLETICFNFTSRMPFPYVIKLGKAFRGSPHPAVYCSYVLKSICSQQEADETGLAAHY